MFGIVLVQTILVYMQAGLVFPDFSESHTIDLRDHYLRQHRWFFSLLCCALIVSVCKDLISDANCHHAIICSFTSCSLPRQ